MSIWVTAMCLQQSTTEKQKQLWGEAANTATMLDNVLVHEQNSAPPYTMVYGKDAKYAKHL